MADISIAIDIPLMHAIAQSSATFVAILAGFYTAKILSISGDMRRITVKIRECDNEISREISDIQNLASRIERIERVWAEERVNSFKDYIVLIPSRIESVNTLDDLKRSFRELTLTHASREPSELELKILEEKSQSILKEIKSNRENLNNRTRDGFDYNIVSLPAERSEAQQFHEVLQSTDERRNKEKMDETIETKRSRMSFLASQRQDLSKERHALAFPKYIRFGYGSFVIFAVLGVVFPLSYSVWGEFLADNPKGLWFLLNSEIIALSLFAIGLGLVFVYIYVELRYARTHPFS